MEENDEERFFMKDHIAVKRFELCVEAVMNPLFSQKSERYDNNMNNSNNKPKQALMNTRSKRANELASYNENDDNSDMEEVFKLTTIKPRINYEEKDAVISEDMPKKRKRKEQPDSKDENTTLEDLFGFNKKLSSLYLKEYEAYKVKQYAIELRRLRTEII